MFYAGIETLTKTKGDGKISIASICLCFQLSHALVANTSRPWQTVPSNCEPERNPYFCKLVFVRCFSTTMRKITHTDPKTRLGTSHAICSFYSEPSLALQLDPLWHEKKRYQFSLSSCRPCRAITWEQRPQIGWKSEAQSLVLFLPVFLSPWANYSKGFGWLSIQGWKPWSWPSSRTRTS